MQLNELGYNVELENYRKENELQMFEVARVTSQHKDRYTVKGEELEFEAEIVGNLRYSVENKNELPAVGDWVAISEYDDGKALIHHVFPRKSTLERKAVGKVGQSQIIATNIDVGIIVQSVNRDFSMNRIERYLTICYAAKIEPLVVLSKVDLVDKSKLDEILLLVGNRIKNVKIIPLSNISHHGISKLESVLNVGKTYCLLGSSGVGKSSLINSLSGQFMMNTGEISERIDRGKHVTTHRELVVLSQGVLIDNPGMREVGITSIDEGLELTFDEISTIAQDCKYSDCSHTNEKGCAVVNAVDQGSLDESTYANFLKMEKEKSFYQTDERERKRKDKSFGKMVRNVSKQRRKNKF